MYGKILHTLSLNQKCSFYKRQGQNRIHGSYPFLGVVITSHPCYLFYIWRWGTSRWPLGTVGWSMGGPTRFLYPLSDDYTRGLTRFPYYLSDNYTRGPIRFLYPLMIVPRELPGSRTLCLMIIQGNLPGSCMFLIVCKMILRHKGKSSLFVHKTDLKHIFFEKRGASHYLAPWRYHKALGI